MTRYAINFPVSGGWIDFSSLESAKEAVKPEYHHEIVEICELSETYYQLAYSDKPYHVATVLP